MAAFRPSLTKENARRMLDALSARFAAGSEADLAVRTFREFVERTPRHFDLHYELKTFIAELGALTGQRRELDAWFFGR